MTVPLPLVVAQIVEALIAPCIRAAQQRLKLPSRTLHARQTIPQPPLTLYDSALLYRSSAVSLGLVFDTHLTWSPHIDSLKISGSPAVTDPLSCVIGCKPHNTPPPPYGPVLVLSKLWLPGVCICFPFSPLVEDLMQFTIRVYALPLVHYDPSQVSTLHNSLAIPDPSVLLLRCSDWPRPNVCDTLLSHPKASSLPQELYSLFMNHMDCHFSKTPVYTDGSKSSAGTGFAVVFPDQGYNFRLP
ncbi:hypothetical protein Pcinc_027469 [Petrolisthes cinctipes]|uniref:Uncharacterized protein n=1 Tax=Petrolisthes cinctipes TaxID=88211 RepID=A0AAE1KA83_PETCI|nr:hypothetical protein Pcinc_027469 [Petrolisthes cinctipes]